MVPANTRFSGFPCQARQQVDVPDCLYRLFCARAVPIIPIPLAGRRAAPSSMHPTDTKAANRRRTTTLPCSLRFSFAPRRVVGALHGVDGHLDLVPPPTPTGSGSLASSRMGMGASELAARRAGDAAFGAAPPPVVTLSGNDRPSAIEISSGYRKAPRLERTGLDRYRP